MAKVIPVSFSNYVYEQYLSSNMHNRSKYIEEMFIKGVNTELNEYKGIQSVAVKLLKENREKDDYIIKLKKQIVLLQSRVMNQKKRKIEKEIEDRKTWRVIQ